MKTEIKKGTRIFYHGDMANNEGFGIVINWKEYDIEIKMDDGRKFNVGSGSFHDKYLGNGLTRFVTEAVYKEWRKEKLKDWKRVVEGLNKGNKK